MGAGQRDTKNYYIAGILGLLVICLIITLWSSNYFKNEVKKHQDNHNQVKKGRDNDNEVNKDNTASENVKEVEITTKKSEVNDVLPPTQCAIKVNAIYSLGLVGVYHWFIREYVKQARETIGVNLLMLGHSVPFILEVSHYIVAAVVVLAMVCYIGYFVSQNYSLDSTCAKDMAILFVGMYLLFELIIKIFIACIAPHPVFFALGIGIGFFSLATLLLPKWLYNNKLALLKQGWSSRIQWLCSAYVLAYLYYETHHIGAANYILKSLLWRISVAFL